MVITRRIPSRGTILRVVGYGAVIVLTALLILWGYARHRANGSRVAVAPPKAGTQPPPAGFDRRLSFASEQELLAPAAFPWSLTAVARLPQAEVRKVRVSRKPTAEGDAEADLAAALAAELTWQAPALARPFAMDSSPPYLVTPVTVDIEFELDDAGRAAAAAVSGAPSDLNARFAEAAAAFIFPEEAGGAVFSARVTLTPYCYTRFTASRGGRPLVDDDYRILFRAMQYGSYGVYDAVKTAAPELLEAGHETRVAFAVDAEGHPERVTFDPAPERGSDDVAAALAAVFLPRRLAGTRVEFILGS